MGRMGQRQRQRLKRQQIAERAEAEAVLDRDAAQLPETGPIAELVASLGAALSRCVAEGHLSGEASPVLRPLGEEAFRLMGTIRGMQAVAHKAAASIERRPEIGRDLIDKAWDGIGDERGAWMA